MSKGRLTRQELGWLLTQEAQGAAERLRSGVQWLAHQAAPVRISSESGDAKGDAKEGISTLPPLDDTLNALDDAMKMLSSLHAKPSTRGRRGRIDLAALIWEVAPDARVSIEPGSGTEIFGDEAELRRMLHVLVGLGSGEGSSVTIRREGDEVKVSVILGPDSSIKADTERAWMNRMAIRYGGRYDLEGGSEVLTFPADVTEREERQELLAELDQARKQGEFYARELATVISSSHPDFPPLSGFPSLHASADRVSNLTRLMGGISMELRTILGPAFRYVKLSSSSSPPLSEKEKRGDDEMRRAVSRAQEFAGVLGRWGEVDPEEARVEVNIVETVNALMGAMKAKAERAGVSLSLAPPPASRIVKAAPRALSILVRELIEHAIFDASPGSEVTIAIGHSQRDSDLVIENIAGPSTPSTPEGNAYIGHGIDTAPPRPHPLFLYIASEFAVWQGATLDLTDTSHGSLRVALKFASS